MRTICQKIVHNLQGKKRIIPEALQDGTQNKEKEHTKQVLKNFISISLLVIVAPYIQGTCSQEFIPNFLFT